MPTTLALRRAARHVLRHHRGAKIALNVAVTVKAAGTSTTTHRTFTLKARPLVKKRR